MLMLPQSVETQSLKSTALLLPVVDEWLTIIEAAEEFEPTVTLLLNVAAPASDISSVRALIKLTPSTPFNIISLSLTEDLTIKSLDELTSSAYVVPASARFILPRSESRLIVPATSTVKSPLDKSISVPSMVMLSTTIPEFA